MHRLIPAAAFVALLALPTAALAQRMPDEGTGAIGGDVGFFLPADDQLEPAPVLDGHFDYYVTPRVGVRFDVGWTDTGYDRGTDDSLRRIRVGANLIYNWEHVEWHPFVGAGLAAHLLQGKENGEALGDGETSLGLALLGGVEYFTSDTVSVKGEARYEFVGDARGGEDPSGFVLSIGLKKYF